MRRRSEGLSNWTSRKPRPEGRGSLVSGTYSESDGGSPPNPGGVYCLDSQIRQTPCRRWTHLIHRSRQTPEYIVADRGTGAAWTSAALARLDKSTPPVRRYVGLLVSTSSPCRGRRTEEISNLSPAIWPSDDRNERASNNQKRVRGSRPKPSVITTCGRRKRLECFKRRER